MRRTLLALLAVAALVSTGTPAPAGAGPGPGYFATDNVEWLGIIPLNADSAGARVLDGYLYITDDRGLTIYDLADPENPQRTGFLAVPQTPYVPEEDVDTNGEILIIEEFGTLNVIDVKDKANPRIIGTVGGAGSHTTTCILDCTWAYGSSGKIFDLRDPTQPKVLTESWTAGLGIASTHDVTEVAPGRVVTSTRPMVYLDVTNPAKPRKLGQYTAPDTRFIHGNLWPRNAQDRWLLVGGETSNLGDGACGPNDGAFMVFDATEVRAADEAEARGDPRPADPRFKMVDEFRVSPGNYVDGGAPYDQFCAHWFTTRPGYADGGLVAMGWYEHGVRFLDVAKETGKITEKGYFLPLGGSTSAAYWITDEILYTADYQRGIDILRFTDKPASGEVAPTAAQLAAHRAALAARPPAARPVTPAAALPGEYVCPLE